MAQTLADSTVIVFIGETFTGDVSTASLLPVAAGKRLQIIGWHLSVVTNSAVAPCQIKASGGTVYAATRFPIQASGSIRWWEGPVGGPGVLPRLPDGEELVIGGGGTAGVLDGYVVVAVS